MKTRPALSLVHAADIAGLPGCLAECTGSSLRDDLRWAWQTEQRWGWCGVQWLHSGLAAGPASAGPAAVYPTAPDPTAPDPTTIDPTATDRVVAYILLAAPGLVVGAEPALHGRAAQLASVWVHPDARGHGSGRQLIQRAAAEARLAQLPAIEAVGSELGASCIRPPSSWLRRAGFAVVRDHPLHPRMRLDLCQTITDPWWSVVWERLQVAVRGPESPPQPTGRESEAVARQTRCLI